MPTRSYGFLFVALLLIAPALAAGHESIRAEFDTEDGVHIVGDYWTPLDSSRPAPAVILLHMYKSNRAAWQPLVPALEKAGFAILAVDLRGHGDSTTPTSMNLGQRVEERDSTLFNAMHQDVTAALKWLDLRDEVNAECIAVVGASVGCSVALDSAVRDPQIGAVVLMTPGTKYLGVDSMAHVGRYGQRPILILSSAEELEVGALPLVAALSPEVETRVRAARASEAVRRNEPAVYSDTSRGADVSLGLFFQTGIHGTRMFGQVPVEQLIADYLAKHVRTAAAEPTVPAATPRE